MLGVREKCIIEDYMTEINQDRMSSYDDFDAVLTCKDEVSAHYSYDIYERLGVTLEYLESLCNMLGYIVEYNDDEKKYFLIEYPCREKK